MKERIRELIDTYGSSERKKYKEIEALTGVKADSWKNVLKGNQRVNQDHINAISEFFPSHLYWIITGKTIPIAGQIAPNDNLLEVKQQCAEQITALIYAAETDKEELTSDELAEAIVDVVSDGDSKP